MKTFWYLLSFLLMVRNESVGVDVSTYGYIFDYIAASEWREALGRSPEMAWSVINKVVAALGGGFRSVIVLSTLLSTFWISRAYLKYTNDVSLTISLFIILPNFILPFSGLRQAIAISLGFLAFEYVRRKKLIPVMCITLIAILFHTSAFMIFFMYPLYHVRITRKWLLFVIPVLSCVFAFNRQIFTVLGLILNQFTDYDTIISETGSITMLILFIIFALFSYVIPEEETLDPDTAGMRNFLLLSVAIQMFAPLHNLAMRMNYYYIAFIPLLIPRIIHYRSAQMAQVAIIARHIMVIFFVIYFFVVAPSDNLLHTFPYQFFWQTA